MGIQKVVNKVMAELKRAAGSEAKSKGRDGGSDWDSIDDSGGKGVAG